MTVVHFQQNTPEWLEWRKDKIGASDAPIIDGISPWCDQHTLMLQKLGLADGPKENWAMSNGKKKEPEILQWFNEKYGLSLQPTAMQSTEYDWMIASLDGYQPAMGDQEAYAAEIKTAGKEDHALAKSGKIPPKYYPQLQHQMKVNGLRSMYYISENGGDKCVVTVPRDTRYISALVAKELKFIEMRDSFIIPKSDAPDYKDLLDDTLLELLNKYNKENEILKNAKKSVDDIKLQIIQHSGDQNVKCGNYYITKSSARGAIDYEKIDELKNVDLEKFRKKDIIKYSIKLKNEENINE